MKRGRLTNKELDELGKQLFIAAEPDEGEIERLVANPRLYDGVLAKIAAADEPVRQPRRRFALKPLAAMAMTLALLSIPLLALLKSFDDGGQNSKASYLRAIASTSQMPTFEKSKVPFNPVPVGPPEDPGDDQRSRPMKAVMTDTVERDRPRRLPIPRAKHQPEPEPVFHPIGLAERAEDAAIDGRVVRVEMPRSALFALGVDLPLENGTRAVKADLLVGADGIPRGIRLVE
jgi:hypothetical protein